MSCICGGTSGSKFFPGDINKGERWSEENGDVGGCQGIVNVSKY